MLHGRERSKYLHEIRKGSCGFRDIFFFFSGVMARVCNGSGSLMARAHSWVVAMARTH